MHRTISRLCSTALVASAILIGSAHGALAQADVSNDQIRCGTVIATTSFRPALTFDGSANSVAIKVKGKLYGCVDLTHPTVIIDSGSFRGMLSGTTNDCMRLTGTQPLQGSLTYKWNANPATPILQTSSVQTVTSWSRATFAPALVNPTFGATNYLNYTLGTGLLRGAFTGGDAGATSQNASVSSENNQFFIANCGSGGIKTIHTGLGTITLG